MGQFKEWVINGLSVLAFFYLIKLLASYLPEMGFLGSFKRVISAA